MRLGGSLLGPKAPGSPSAVPSDADLENGLRAFDGGPAALVPEPASEIAALALLRCRVRKCESEVAALARGGRLLLVPFGPD